MNAADYVTHLRAEVDALTEAVRIRREDLAEYEQRLADAKWRLAAAELYTKE